MKLVKPSQKITFHIPEGYTTVEQFLEEVGRTPYKSEEKITDGSAQDFVAMLVNRTHWAMIEHAVATVRFIADRGFSHELVRHRIASFAQESTRFVNYTRGRHGNSITVVELPDVTGMTQELLDHWQSHAVVCEDAYFKAEMLAKEGGVKKTAEVARMFLPIGVKTEIVITANLREWNTVFGLRADEPAHPIMRGLARKVLQEFHARMPTIYGPIYRLRMPMSELTEGELEAARFDVEMQLVKLETRAAKLAEAIRARGAEDAE